MGVDRTAFSFYGIRIETTAYPKFSHEELNALIPSDLRVEVIEWGSRPYGGRWGLALVCRETYAGIDFDEGVGLRALEKDRDRDLVRAVSRLQDARYAILKAGHEIDLVLEAGWFVGGATY